MARMREFGAEGIELGAALELECMAHAGKK